MVDRLGFVPPSEATLPCHDICHIFDEISTHGLIRYRNLFKFERMNSFMKQTLKNRAHGIASIMKNYNTHERTTMSGTIYLDNVAKFQSLCKLQPINGLPFQSLGSYVTSIHVEPPEETGEDRTILYDIPSSNVIEFRGASMNITLTRQDINYLLEDNMDICYEAGFSVLKCIMVGYKTHCTKYPQQFNHQLRWRCNPGAVAPGLHDITIFSRHFRAIFLPVKKNGVFLDFLIPKVGVRGE